MLGELLMSQDLDDLIELSLLREEVKSLKSYAARLERENASLMDCLSHRRPSSAARRQVERIGRRWGWRLQLLGPPSGGA